MTITEYVSTLSGMLVCLAVVGLLAVGFIKVKSRH